MVLLTEKLRCNLSAVFPEATVSVPSGAIMEVSELLPVPIDQVNQLEVLFRLQNRE